MSHLEIAALVVTLLTAAGWRASSQRASRAIRVERERSAVYRRSLAAVTAVTTGARNARCPTCLANWSAVHAQCESGLVEGDAGGKSPGGGAGAG